MSVTAIQPEIKIVEVGIPGPPGKDGTAAVPDPASIANSYMMAVQEGQWVVIPPPSGTGDMQSLIYDPQGRATNVFDIGNLTGVIDGGVFT